MNQLVKRFGQSRLLRLGMGASAVYLVGIRIWQLRDQPPSENWTTAFLWGSAFLALVLLVWRERNLSAGNRAAREEHERFIAAAETSTESFIIYTCARGPGGEIEDFRFKYVNAPAEALLEMPRADLIGKKMSALFPISRTEGLFDRYCTVVSTGMPLSEEFSIPQEEGSPRWFRHRIVKLGDGLAITASEVTEIREREERLRKLSNFSDSVFEHAPYSIIETDAAGVIRAMNAAAETLTGYSRAELQGVTLMKILREPEELMPRPERIFLNDQYREGSFHLLSAIAASKQSEEQEWTYIRRDGSTLPVHLAMTAVQSDAEKITGFIAIASDITERRQMMTYLSHMASHDPLTDMPGRILLRERIADAIEKAAGNGRKVAVLVLDFDHFKRLNDSLGHKAGDRILMGMAERLRQALRRSDTVGRLGGDELIMVLPHMPGIEDVELCARRLVDRVAGTGTIGEIEMNLTASVGVCIYPDFAEDVDSLLERADAAMYAAKGQGGNRHQVFTDAMLRESQDRMSMDGALRHALAREELFLHYQPIVSLIAGRVIGMEALLRWHHPKLGVVPPSTFIPLAEESGMIIPIGEWAFKRACVQTRMISDELGMDLSVSVNLSPRQFEQSNLLTVIEDALSESRLPAKNLQVELTENTLMINSASNLGKLQEIRRLGARVAIDDFGTGFCSFSYLLQYPVDRLKIDQSFVSKATSDPNAATVVRTIVAMSHHLGVKVIAEGIETVDHLNFLMRRKCDEAQGFLFSRPVAAAGFAEAVASIHRLLDERRGLALGTRSAETGLDRIEPLESRDAPFAPYDKQVVM
jgi:diguanylate cyclase (GGDEF)-like protein/PAS domain S-box-containing protein